MPQQITDVTLTNLGNGQVNIQIGPYGYERELSSLFDRASIDPQQLFDNCRLAAVLAGVAQPATVEYVNAVNRDGEGIQLKNRVYWLAGKPHLVDVDAQVFHIGISETKLGAEVYGFDVPASSLIEDMAPDHEIVIRNIGSLLRKGGFSTLTAGAIAAVKAATFWC